MRQPPRWFELFVRVTFPGGLIRDVDLRLLVLWALPVLAVLGLGLGMVGVTEDSRSAASVVGGFVTLLGLGAFLLAYGVTLRHIVRVDRQRPDGRHAAR